MPSKEYSQYKNTMKMEDNISTPMLSSALNQVSPTSGSSTCTSVTPTCSPVGRQTSGSTIVQKRTPSPCPISHCPESPKWIKRMTPFAMQSRRVAPTTSATSLLLQQTRASLNALLVSGTISTEYIRNQMCTCPCTISHHFQFRVPTRLELLTGPSGSSAWSPGTGLIHVHCGSWVLPGWVRPPSHDQSGATGICKASGQSNNLLM